MNSGQPVDGKREFAEMFAALGAGNSFRNERRAAEPASTRNQKWMMMATFFPSPGPPLPVDLVPEPLKVLPALPERRRAYDEDAR